MTEPHADIEPLVHAHYSGVWRYCRLLGCSHAEADDLAQDTFLAVLSRPFEVRSSAATAAYLRRVARNLLIDRRRRENRKLDIQHALAAERVFMAVAPDGGDRWMSALRRCMETLPTRTREALDDAYGNGSTTAEVARRMGMKENGAKTLLQRARRALKNCIEKRLGHD